MPRSDPPRARLRSRFISRFASRVDPADRDDDRRLQSLLNDTYRQLEHAYRCSPEYGRMVELYPVLARSIAQCRQAELQGEPALVGDSPRTLRLLPEVRRPGHHVHHHARQRQRHGDHHRDGAGVVG